MESLLLQIEIIGPALIAGLLILMTHVPLGREVLNRGIIFLDLAIAQIAAFGVVCAHTFWLHGHSDSGADDHQLIQTLIAIVAAVVGSLGLYRLRRFDLKVQEAIIGILFILSATGSLLLLSADPHGGERLKEILVGQILWIQLSDLLSLAVIYTLVLWLWFAGRVRLGEWLFYPIFAVTITLSTQVVGVYLVFASLIIPALATLQVQKGLLKSYLLGAAGYAVGLLASAMYDLPAGAAIVWGLAAVALFYYLLFQRKRH